MAKAPTIEQLKARLIDAEVRGSTWLADANEAKDRGHYATAERRYDKAQYWLDVANNLRDRILIERMK